MKYVDPKGLDWGQWDDENGKRHYWYFDGKVGSHNGHTYAAVQGLANGGSRLVYDDSGELFRIRNNSRNYLEDVGRWQAASVTNPAQDQVNQLAGFVHGVGSALAGFNPGAHMLVNAATHQIGGADESDPGYHNADAIGNGLVLGAAIFTPAPEAEAAAEGVTLFHGSDAVSIDNILAEGLNQSAAAERGGGDIFWTTTNIEHAQFFAEANPAGGSPALLRVDISHPALQQLMQKGAVEVQGTTYKFLGSAWQELNKLATFSRVP